MFDPAPSQDREVQTFLGRVEAVEPGGSKRLFDLITVVHQWAEEQAEKEKGELRDAS